MISLLRKYPFHSLFVTIFPILSLWASNYSVVVAADVQRALIVSCAVVLGTAGILRLLRFHSIQIGFFLSLSAALFFSYGQVLLGLARAQIDGRTTLSPVTVTLLYLLAWIIGTWVAIHWGEKGEFPNLLLNVSSLSMVLMTVVQMIFIAAQAVNYQKVELYQQIINASQKGAAVETASQPDIYYVILDGYGGADGLEKFLQFDNQAFIRALEERGFYVVAHSTSNYANTAPSLASSLNFEYINPFINVMGRQSSDYRPIRDLIHHNRVMAFLENQGYRTAAFETGISITEIKDADYYLNTQQGPNTFESLLLTNSLAILWTRDSFAEQYRNRIPENLQKTGRLTEIPSPKFVFAHVMAAHPPFVFGKNGEVFGSGTSVEMDKAMPEDRVKNLQAYKDQVTYVNSLVLQMIDEILLSSSKPPIILIQGDHGPGIDMDWQSAEATCFTERKSILNAYYLPDGMPESLYATITPVNSFRVIFNEYFGANYPMLEDRNYFSLSESPYNFIDVTDQQGKCP